MGSIFAMKHCDHLSTHGSVSGHVLAASELILSPGHLITAHKMVRDVTENTNTQHFSMLRPLFYVLYNTTINNLLVQISILVFPGQHAAALHTDTHKSVAVHLLLTIGDLMDADDNSRHDPQMLSPRRLNSTWLAEPSGAEPHAGCTACCKHKTSSETCKHKSNYFLSPDMNTSHKEIACC